HNSAYLADWSRTQFGPRAGPLVAKYYEAYFDAPTRYATRNNLEMGDNLYQQISKDLLLRIVRGERPPGRVVEKDASTQDQLQKLGLTYAEYLAGLTQAAAGAEMRWGHAAELAAAAEPQVPAARRDFFRGHVLAQLAVQRSSNRMLGNVAAAAMPGIPVAERLTHVRAAIGDEQKVLDALRDAGYGRWDGFYTKGDWFVNVPLTMALAEVCRKHLEGGQLSASDRETMEAADQYITANSSKGFVKIKAYQGSRRVEFCRP
ncbi:MAG: hypothetical protein NTY38_14405, partial [Acidobacteria bacterium]|nr:hypothetical protein [Acidobacteriota bacterium]